MIVVEFYSSISRLLEILVSSRLVGIFCRFFKILIGSSSEASEGF